MLDLYRFYRFPSFNPRLPGGRRRAVPCPLRFAFTEFQSTPSGGKATRMVDNYTFKLVVSIHAFRGEGDTSVQRSRICTKFQSTPSGGKATEEFCCLLRRPSGVSIHAFRGEGDKVSSAYCVYPSCFNPRLPGGRRLGYSEHSIAQAQSFNPRLPGGRRHKQPDSVVRFVFVSIHAFRGEGDEKTLHLWRLLPGFNPRLPGGRRRHAPHHVWPSPAFQSTPSGGKATAAGMRQTRPQSVSIHAFRGEGDGCAVRRLCTG